MFHFHVCCNLYLTTYSTCRLHLLPHFFPFHSCIPGLAASKIHYELPANARKRKNGQANPLQCYCIVRFGNAIRPRYWTRRYHIARDEAHSNRRTTRLVPSNFGLCTFFLVPKFGAYGFPCMRCCPIRCLSNNLKAHWQRLLSWRAIVLPTTV
jgi:hypothetical protein